MEREKRGRSYHVRQERRRRARDRAPPRRPDAAPADPARNSGGARLDFSRDGTRRGRRPRHSGHARRRAWFSSTRSCTTNRRAAIGSCFPTTSPTACSAAWPLFEHMLKRLKLKRGEVSADGASQRRPDLLHRNVRPGAGAPRQQSAGHPPDRSAGRRDLRPCARRRSALRMAGRLLPGRGQYPPRRRPARLALRGRIGDCGRRSRSAARACSTR